MAETNRRVQSIIDRFVTELTQVAREEAASIVLEGLGTVRGSRCDEAEARDVRDQTTGPKDRRDQQAARDENEGSGSSDAAACCGAEVANDGLTPGDAVLRRGIKEGSEPAGKGAKEGQALEDLGDTGDTRCSSPASVPSNARCPAD